MVGSGVSMQQYLTYCKLQVGAEMVQFEEARSLGFAHIYSVSHKLDSHSLPCGCSARAGSCSATPRTSCLRRMRTTTRQGV